MERTAETTRFARSKSCSALSFTNCANSSGSGHFATIRNLAEWSSRPLAGSLSHTLSVTNGITGCSRRMDASSTKTRLRWT